MPKEDAQLIVAKRAYRNAKAEGNRQEEARWANVVGDILKNKGEYVEALKWLRVDYEVSVRYLPEKQLLPTCQSLGEVYLRLQYFKDALIYQKKHLELAKDTNDLVEQQRASTQLGRTYHEMFLNSDDDHYSVRNAKKYFKLAMKLAETLKENPPSDRSCFVKEYIDAHNNIGMLEMDLDNFEEALKHLGKGLEICDEEEVTEDDAGRSRLHHNLGNVYMELRKWDRAREHIKKDIIICKKICHCQGEAKGFINLGELHYRVQKYEEAIQCYQKALNLAKSMEDEDALAGQIDQNIQTVKSAIKVMDEIKNEEQNLKKLMRNMENVRGTSGERKCLLKQNASLDCLIEKSSMIFAWLKHRGFSKMKKKITTELCDKEKLSDSFLVIGESYQKLRNFSKALKWYTRSWESYKSIGNLEGQSLAKINIGDVLDSDGDWAGALDAFEEGYGIALQANLPSVQLSALENMHYSYMIRFDNVEEARRLQSLIDKLKRPERKNLDAHNMVGDCCSETETEEDNYILDSSSDMNSSPERSKSTSVISKTHTREDELNDNVPLISLLRSNHKTLKHKTARVSKPITPIKPIDSKSMPSSASSQQTVVGRKRIRVILSDDEGEKHDVRSSGGRIHEYPVEDMATSDEFKSRSNPVASASEFEDAPVIASKCATSSRPGDLDESSCSHRSKNSNVAAQDAKSFKFSSIDEVVSTSDFGANGGSISEIKLHKCKAYDPNLHTITDNHGQYVNFKVDEDFINVELGSFTVGDKLNIEHLKAQVACLYYLQLPAEKRSRGLLPIIKHMDCGGITLEYFDAVDTLKDQISRKGWIDVSIDGWVQKRLMNLYINCCKDLSELPNLNVLKKLYNLEVSEDEVLVSDCELQDISVAPLLNALGAHKTVSVLDLSHNLLGNGTMEKLQQLFTSSSQTYGGLVLDLHSNCFGPTALFQICECPVLFARLEVLNISGNRLTDACASYLSTILRNCKVLYSLNLEHCSITSRSIQRIADSLDTGSILEQISLGYNPISGNAMVNLLTKLATLSRFQKLNLNGLKLSKPIINSLCQLAKTSCLSALMLGDTSIGTEGALQLTESLSSGAKELVKFDLSSCGLTSQYIVRLNAEVSLITQIVELNLGGNPIAQEGSDSLASLLTNPHCSLRVLVLNNCQLQLVGILRILQALAENCSLEELNLAENTDLEKVQNLPIEFTPVKVNSNLLPTDLNLYDNALEVADSEEDQIGIEPVQNSGATSCPKIPSLSDPYYVHELSAAICAAKQLQVLDLSKNGFSEQVAEALYGAWLSPRGDLARRHIHECTIHFSVQGNQCCSVKPCCKKD